MCVRKRKRDRERLRKRERESGSAASRPSGFLSQKDRETDGYGKSESAKEGEKEGEMERVGKREKGNLFLASIFLL